MNKSVERKSYSIGQVKGKLAGMGDVDTDVRTALICGSGSLLEWGQAEKNGAGPGANQGPSSAFPVVENRRIARPLPFWS